MKTWLQRGVLRWLNRPRVVPVGDCVHFCGFRYGRGEVNPYEEYALALVRGESLSAARGRFEDFLRHYRPRSLGEALGVDLSRTYGLWQFPWDMHAPAGATGIPGWVEDPDDAPDIMTHFSEKGILRFRIEEEFGWTESLFYSIRRHGFQPRPRDRIIEACELEAQDGARRYLLLDGNHRVSVLAALGEATVALRRVRLKPVRESALLQWPGVRDGIWLAEDARRVFRAYFDGNRRSRTTEVPVAILEANAGGRA